MPRGAKKGQLWHYKIIDGKTKRQAFFPNAVPDTDWILGYGPLSEETKKKISEKMKRIPLPEGFSAKKGTKWFRRYNDVLGDWEIKRINPGDPEPGVPWVPGQMPRTEEVKEKLRVINTGRIISDEWRARMSAASKGKPKSEAHKAANKLAQEKRHARKKLEKLLDEIERKLNNGGYDEPI
jgi:hypothetical protein